MILSMTGYGTGSAQKDDTAVSVEIRTVNHRFLDLHIRLSREYLFLEGVIQQLVRKALTRGRVDVNVTIQKAAGLEYVVNSGMVTSYLETAARLKDEFNLQDSLDLRTLLNLPGVLKNNEVGQADDSSEVPDLLKQSVQAALEGVLQMRQREGEALRLDMLQNLAAIEESTHRIRQVSVDAPAEYLEKLNARLAQLLPKEGIDPQRLAQEAAMIADKCDISEEVVRARSHIKQFRAIMDSTEPAGRKLNFLIQELNREFNTMGSKTEKVNVSHNIVAVKSELEKIREQLQNVE